MLARVVGQFTSPGQLQWVIEYSETTAPILTDMSTLQGNDEDDKTCLETDQPNPAQDEPTEQGATEDQTGPPFGGEHDRAKRYVEDIRRNVERMPILPKRGPDLGDPTSYGAAGLEDWILRKLFAELVVLHLADDIVPGGNVVSHLEQADDIVIFSASPLAAQQKHNNLAAWCSVNFAFINTTETQTQVMVFNLAGRQPTTTELRMMR
ncbi:uncharacterized protein B0H18DRAFT_1118157 [Fomitopsis serialis]|uniref:uncharacterized protein n=1 Tax=Fomitopsis serialis TaxID=139415 RepID=UPI002007453C|nr:uncharacterized protein B0H18DRAFT_1118157 [Neoantrodia serialis]KAH9928138.1 hypothetical protein B0H18DRAFT_1118157 [Neoantrodia serialis]